jgi:hypothetical protein
MGGDNGIDIVVAGVLVIALLELQLPRKTTPIIMAMPAMLPLTFVSTPGAAIQI